MCNAWNHSPGCTCGWGGDGHLGRRTFGNSYSTWSVYGVLSKYDGSLGREQICTESYVNPNARCPVCGAQVFFYQSPYGGRVYFDELGWPWPKHPCTDNSQHYRSLTPSDSATLDRLCIRLGEASLSLWPYIGSSSSPRSAPSAPPQPKKIDEEAFAKYMEQGETAECNGDTHQAAMHFAEAINENFRSARAWLALAKVLTDKDERAYCLTKALRVATTQDRIRIEAVKSELARLKVDQLRLFLTIRSRIER